jgi:protease PrsW
MKKLKVLNSRWFQILAGGALLFIGSEQALKFTGNPNFVPTVILLGALVVPATFVAFFYGRERKLEASYIESPLVLVLICFIVGGAIGVVSAGFIEYETLKSLTIPGLFGVGLIEESAKLILPVIIYIRSKYLSEIDGLLFGVSSGMGFAALETMGYGFVALLQSNGSIGTLEEVLLMRGLLSPIGHAAWTGLVCASLWHERQRTHKMFNPRVIGIFVLAIFLHAVWDIAGSIQQIYIVLAGFVIIGTVSMVLLIRKLREATRIKTADTSLVVNSK